ncbi:MAG: hypothetical protein ORO03_10050 [Alphaproteobacteria bacterium]|nr:hypothetical protein [Alphaproteobacteria bacterium]
MLKINRIPVRRVVRRSKNAYPLRFFVALVGIAGVVSVLLFLVSSFVTFASVLEHYQTLAAGIGTVVAALWTIGALRQQIEVQQKQIEEHERQYEDQRIRKVKAARAIIPLALNNVGIYLQESIVIIERFEVIVKSKTQWPGSYTSLSVPVYPVEDVELFRDHIEHSNHSDELSEMLVVLLFCLQIFRARMDILNSKFQEFDHARETPDQASYEVLYTRINVLRTCAIAIYALSSRLVEVLRGINIFSECYNYIDEAGVREAARILKLDNHAEFDEFRPVLSDAQTIKVKV